MKKFAVSRTSKIANLGKQNKKNISTNAEKEDTCELRMYIYYVYMQ